MGLWNSHTSVGNILGSLIAGYWVSSNWGLSFIVPGLIIAVMGVVCFFFLIERKFSLLDVAVSGGLSFSQCERHFLFFTAADPNDLRSMYAQNSSPGKCVSVLLSTCVCVLLSISMRD